MRFVGIKNKKIRVVSNNKFVNPELETVELPSEFDDIKPNDLMLHYRYDNEEFFNIKSPMPANKMRIAFIANYGGVCGIGLYSRHLIESMAPYLEDFRIFSEETDEIYLEEPKISSDKIIPCWKRGESLQRLVDEVIKYQPHRIIIQHEFGLYPNARHFISMMGQLNEIPSLVTFHSTFDHIDKAVEEAVCPEIIVHVDGGKEALLRKGITSKIHVIPHGCFPPIKEQKPWNFYRTKHTFIQYGFLFKYKAFETSIEAVALLKEKYPDIFFTGICSESPHAALEHQLYFEKLTELVERLGVKENVGLIRGFQSDKVLDTFLRMNRAAVFPYRTDSNHSCYGASGCGPTTMAKGIPIISSNAPHFAHLPTIKAETAQDIADSLDKLYSNDRLIKEQIEKQYQYLLENSWEETAKKYLALLENQ